MTSRNTRSLTYREEWILFLLSRGMDRKEVSKRLGITENTLRTYLRSLAMKTGYKNTMHIVTAYMRGELVKEGKEG